MTPDQADGFTVGPFHGAVAAETLSGDRVLEDLGEALDELCSATDAPVTSRRPWLAAWARAYRSYEPWAILVRDARSGRLAAAALLCRRETESGTEVAGLGHGRNDRTRLVARTPTAAKALAEGITSNLSSLPAPWTFRLDQLPKQDPVADAITRMLPSTWLIPAAPVPLVTFGSGEDAESYLGRNMRKQLRRSRRSLEEDSVKIHLSFDDDPDIIADLVQEVERTHRERDHAVGRRSDLDVQQNLQFWRDVILEHAARHQIEVATLRFNDQLASYVVSLLDPISYRVLDGRLAPAWAQYSPGRLVEASTLARALADPRFTELDWMNSVASEKLVAANSFDETEHLVGRSPPAGDAPADLIDLIMLDEQVHGRPTADLALAALQASGL